MALLPGDHKPTWSDLTKDQATKGYLELIHSVWTSKELETIPLEHIQPALIQLLKEGMEFLDMQGQIDIWVKPHGNN